LFDVPTGTDAAVNGSAKEKRMQRQQMVNTTKTV
jgi:hypothetical protein